MQLYIYKSDVWYIQYIDIVYSFVKLSRFKTQIESPRQQEALTMSWVVNMASNTNTSLFGNVIRRAEQFSVDKFNVEKEMSLESSDEEQNPSQMSLKSSDEEQNPSQILQTGQIRKSKTVQAIIDRKDVKENM